MVCDCKANLTRAWSSSRLGTTLVSPPPGDRSISPTGSAEACKSSGAPGFPVVMTSIYDCSIGAGFTPDGGSQFDTVNSCTGTVGASTADVVVLMDESASMAFAQIFSEQLITDLEVVLSTPGLARCLPIATVCGALGISIQLPMPFPWELAAHCLDRSRICNSSRHG